MGNDKVYINFPKAGLGNLMLVWARGLVFAYENNLELFTDKWWAFHFGAWVRRERKKRFYWGYFKDDVIFKRIRLLFYKLTSKKIYEPKTIVSDRQGNKLYVFQKLFISNDYFKELKPHRDYIRRALCNQLKPELAEQLKSFPKPVIGIHIRRGDFKIGSTLTPVEFFVDSINRIRKEYGKEFPVTVFTDAEEHEISEVLKLPSIFLAEPKADILDILLLSTSDICIISISSTFSLWAAFLSDGIILKHPNEWHPVIRPEPINKIHYEGSFDSKKEIDLMLRNQILALNDV